MYRKTDKMFTNHMILNAINAYLKAARFPVLEILQLKKNCSLSSFYQLLNDGFFILLFCPTFFYITFTVLYVNMN